MLKTSFRGIYHEGSANKFIGNIEENIKNYRKILAIRNLDLNNYENIKRIGNLKNLRETRDICNTILEHYFEFVRCVHVPRMINDVTDALSNYVLYFHLSHECKKQSMHVH